jgi:hypothetical protein
MLTSNRELRILSRTSWLVQESITSALLDRNSLAAKSLNKMGGGGVDAEKSAATALELDGIVAN